MATDRLAEASDVAFLLEPSAIASDGPRDGRRRMVVSFDHQRKMPERIERGASGRYGPRLGVEDDVGMVGQPGSEEANKL